MRAYPDDETCLDFLWRKRFAPDGHHAVCPKCQRERKFHRDKTRRSYSCDTCGRHVHPTAGTIFHKSSTSLHLWFFAMYLMTSTRCGVSAKHLERELGVTYKTAWRMFSKIRNQLLVDDGVSPPGEADVDEESFGGQPRRRRPRNEAQKPRERQKPRDRGRAAVLTAVARRGRIKARVLAS